MSLALLISIWMERFKAHLQILFIVYPSISRVNITACNRRLACLIRLCWNYSLTHRSQFHLFIRIKNAIHEKTGVPQSYLRFHCKFKVSIHSQSFINESILRKTLMTALKQIQTMDCRIYNLNL